MILAIITHHIHTNTKCTSFQNILKEKFIVIQKLKFNEKSYLYQQKTLL